MYWFYKHGPHNDLTDVPGVKVGHYTLEDESQGIYTGLTAILPGRENPFKDKLTAATHTINGFGKPLGLEQVRELGQLESPILLTNTLSVGDAARGLIDYMLSVDENIGRPTTVNPLVMECNDGTINDIRKLAIEKDHVLQAIEAASSPLIQGPVGAGRGMVCYGLKGGIGSSSRIFSLEGKTYTLAALCLCNFGSCKDLSIQGQKLGPLLDMEASKDRGSIVTVLATDLPLDKSLLQRMSRRVQSGIARTGAYTGTGSGEFVLAFTTAREDHLKGTDPDPLFLATVEAVEEAILQALYHGQTSKTYDGKTILSLKDRARDRGLSLPNLEEN